MSHTKMSLLFRKGTLAAVYLCAYIIFFNYLDRYVCVVDYELTVPSRSTDLIVIQY